jgi:hypothetical protein
LKSPEEFMRDLLGQPSWITLALIATAFRLPASEGKCAFCTANAFCAGPPLSPETLHFHQFVSSFALQDCPVASQVPQRQIIFLFQVLGPSWPFLIER